jgi:hypothetical protein
MSLCSGMPGGGSGTASCGVVTTVGTGGGSKTRGGDGAAANSAAETGLPNFIETGPSSWGDITADAFVRWPCRLDRISASTSTGRPLAVRFTGGASLESCFMTWKMPIDRSSAPSLSDGGSVAATTARTASSATPGVIRLRSTSIEFCGSTMSITRTLLTAGACGLMPRLPPPRFGAASAMMVALRPTICERALPSLPSRAWESAG